MKMNSFLFGVVLVTTFGLAACGGSGSSTSSGGGGSTQYAGLYVGDANVSGFDSSGRNTYSFTETKNVSVSNTGEVTGFMFNFAGASPPRNCTATPPIYLNGNKFSYSYTFSCNGGGTTKSTGSGAIDGKLMTVRVDKTFSGGSRSITQFKGVLQ